MREQVYLQLLRPIATLRARDVAQQHVLNQELIFRHDKDLGGVPLAVKLRYFIEPFVVSALIVAGSWHIGVEVSLLSAVVFVAFLRWAWLSDTTWLYCRAVAREIPIVAELIAAELEAAPTARMAITECLANCPTENGTRRILYRILLGDDSEYALKSSPLHTNALLALLETLPVSDRNGAARLRGWADIVREANHRLGKREAQVNGAVRTLFLIAAIICSTSFFADSLLADRAVYQLGEWSLAVQISLYSSGCLAFIGGSIVAAVWRREVWRD